MKAFRDTGRFFLRAEGEIDFVKGGKKCAEKRWGGGSFAMKIRMKR